MTRDTYWKTISGVLSAILFLVVSFLVYGPRLGNHAVDVSLLPHINVILNGLSAVCILLGYYFIAREQEYRHRVAMLSAFVLSTMFLTSYIIYHYFQATPKAYTGQVPFLYFPVLIIHILMAAVIAPLILITLYRGWVDDRQRHRKLAHWTWPAWLMVSLSGILVYLMLYIPL